MQDANLNRTGGGRGDGRLLHLKDTKHFDIPDGEPDIRGWEVRTRDGRKIGEVEDLLVDTELGRIRYLEVEVDRDLRKAGGRDYTLVPVGAARLDDERDDVIVEMAADDLTGVPAYDRERMSEDYERQLRSHYERSFPRHEEGTRADDVRYKRDEDFYAHPYFDDRTFFGSRRGGREDRPYLQRRAD